jgi:hypothetical protein
MSRFLVQNAKRFKQFRTGTRQVRHKRSQIGIQGPAACRRAVTKPNEDPIKFREKLLDFFQVNKVLEEMLETKSLGGFLLPSQVRCKAVQTAVWT